MGSTARLRQRGVAACLCSRCSRSGTDMPRKVAAIFAHPDDEVLGCGGAMAWHAGQGDEVRILLLATGLRSRGPAADSEIARLRDQARKAADCVGGKSVEFSDFPD